MTDTSRHRHATWTKTGIRATASGDFNAAGPPEASLTWIGRPGQYLEEPGSIGGVSRMAARQLGGTLGLLHAAAIELSRLDRLGFELEVTRICSPIADPRISDAHFPPHWGRTGRLVVVPARDEAERIEACIASIQPQSADVLVVANNCTDATFSVAVQAGASVFGCTIPFGGVGSARRLGVSEGLRHSDDVQAILTTDADCTLAPD